MMRPDVTFDPTRYLISIDGRDYLEVKWRIVWLRDSHPDAQIETELVSSEEDRAIFRARVAIPGHGSATGWGSERQESFPNFLESAETKAIGRALGALGFGTQFCTDFDLDTSGGQLADAPVAMHAIGEDTSSYPSGQTQPGRTPAASERQVGLIRVLAKEQKLSQKDLEALAQDVTGHSMSELSKKEASQMIQSLQSRQLEPLKSAS